MMAIKRIIIRLNIKIMTVNVGSRGKYALLAVSLRFFANREKCQSSHQEKSWLRIHI